MRSQPEKAEGVGEMAYALGVRGISEKEGDHPPWLDLGDAIREALDRFSNLEAAADALLEAAGAFRRGSGIYTERQLTRKIRQERDRLPRIDETSLPPDLVSYLVERQMDELIDASRLSTRQEIILRLHLCGFDCGEIAASLKCRHQSVVVLLRDARRKLQATYAEGRYAGWYEVYLSEVNRPAYRRR